MSDEPWRLDDGQVATIRRLRRQLEALEVEQRRLRAQLAQRWDVNLHLSLVELDEAHARLFWACQANRHDLFVEGQMNRLMAGIEGLLGTQD